MLHRTIAASLSVLLVCVPAVPASPQAHESELSLGIRQAREGEFDQAVITLDTVARRLEGQAGSAKDLARAHVYLSVAHLGLGRQADARTHAERALRLDPALQVTTKEFPPRVVRVFDEARRAVPAQAPAPRPTTTTAASSTPPTTTPPSPATGPAAPRPVTPSAASSTPPKKGGGGSKALWIGLGAVAVGGGVAAVAAGGGGGTSSESQSTTPPRTVTASFPGPIVVASGQDRVTSVSFPVGTGTIVADGTNGGQFTLFNVGARNGDVYSAILQHPDGYAFHSCNSVFGNTSHAAVAIGAVGKKADGQWTLTLAAKTCDGIRATSAVTMDSWQLQFYVR